MDNANRFIEYLESTAAQLTLDQLSLLDFDHLRERLVALAAHLKAQRDLAEDHHLLRDDYTRRIGGMLKAIAAAERTRRAPLDILDEINSLDSLPADQLVARYRRAAARFRDTFPDPIHHLRHLTTSLPPRLYK